MPSPKMITLSGFQSTLNQQMNLGYSKPIEVKTRLALQRANLKFIRGQFFQHIYAQLLRP